MDECQGLSIRVETNFQKIMATVCEFCSNRGDETSENQAPLYFKSDLQAIVRVLCSTAFTESDYVNASLAVVMLYMYGRRSDAK